LADTDIGGSLVRSDKHTPALSFTVLPAPSSQELVFLSKLNTGIGLFNDKQLAENTLVFLARWLL